MQNIDMHELAHTFFWNVDDLTLGIELAIVENSDGSQAPSGHVSPGYIQALTRREPWRAAVEI